MTIKTIPIISKKDTAPKTPPITAESDVFDVDDDIVDLVPVTAWILKVISMTKHYNYIH